MTYEPPIKTPEACRCELQCFLCCACHDCGEERVRKRKEIADSIAEAEESGLYDYLEHLSGSGVWL